MNLLKSLTYRILVVRPRTRTYKAGSGPKIKRLIIGLLQQTGGIVERWKLS